MKNIKKAASLLVTLSMLASAAVSVSAANGTGEYHDAYTTIAAADYENSSKASVNFTGGGTQGFMYNQGETVSYLVDFGERNANTLIANMRPNLNNQYGTIGVYIDDESDPVITFDQKEGLPYASYATYAAGGYCNHVFNLKRTLTDKHTVTFKAISSAATGMNSFYFTDSTVSAGDQLKPSGKPFWGSVKNINATANDGESDTTIIQDLQGAVYIPGVDFGDGSGDTYAGVNVRMMHWASTPEGNGAYEVRLDSVSGKVIGTLSIDGTSSKYETYQIYFNEEVTGVHTLVFRSPITTNISYIQGFTIPSAYKTYWASGTEGTEVNDAFRAATGATSYSYTVNFGSTKPEYVALSMRPALEDAANGGKIEVYIDDNASPAATFTVYRTEVYMNITDNEWFEPLELGEDFDGGVHKVTFKTPDNARSTFRYFRFDTTETKDAYSSINAVDRDYIERQGNGTSSTGGTSYIYYFGYWGNLYASAAFTKVDFGTDSSKKAILRVNNLDTLSNGAGKMEIRLGDRYGEVIGTLNVSDMTYNQVKYYDVELTKELSGVQDIVITSDFCTNFYSFSFEKYAAPAEPEASVAIDAQAAVEDTIGVKSVVAKDDDAEITEYGTSFIPAALFDNDDFESVTVKYDGDIENGTSYSALLTGIPAAYRGTSIFATSFINVNGVYKLSDTVSVESDKGE